MACFSPLRAWRTDDGEILFRAEAGGLVPGMRGKPTSPHQSLSLPCGQCVGCRLERSRQWAMRCMHEAQSHELSSFVTLTYSEDHVPEDGSLRYDHFQDFMKRVRWHHGPVRFYMCGEYGEQYGRPHYHACIFGLGFRDGYVCGRGPGGHDIYRSPTLEKLWPMGYSSYGAVTFESAAYVARYVLKKVTGSAADDHYWRLNSATGELHKIAPEFTHMSLKPGIGADWFKRYKADMALDYVVIRGRKCKPPRYYDKLLQSEQSFQWEQQQFIREDRAALCSEDNTPARLAVRATVTRARLAFKKRSLE